MPDQENERRKRTIQILHRANTLWCDLAGLCYGDMGAADGPPESVAWLYAAYECLLDTIEHLHVAIRKGGK